MSRWLPGRMRGIEELLIAGPSVISPTLPLILMGLLRRIGHCTRHTNPPLSSFSPWCVGLAALCGAFYWWFSLSQELSLHAIRPFCLPLSTSAFEYISFPRTCVLRYISWVYTLSGGPFILRYISWYSALLGDLWSWSLYLSLEYISFLGPWS